MTSKAVPLGSVVSACFYMGGAEQAQVTNIRSGCMSNLLYNVKRKFVTLD
jgi:hypothetical protein